jgi:hypothetical protein
MPCGGNVVYKLETYSSLRTMLNINKFMLGRLFFIFLH